MGADSALIRPFLALLVVGVAAVLLGAPARAGGGDPVSEIEATVAQMESGVSSILNQLNGRLAAAESEHEQWAAYLDAVGQIETKREYKSAAIEAILLEHPELAAVGAVYLAAIDEAADNGLVQAAQMYESARPPVRLTLRPSVPTSITLPPSAPTSITLPVTSTTIIEPTTTTLLLPTTTTLQLPTTSTTRPRQTTTTRPRQTTTTTSHGTTTTTSPPPASTPSTTLPPPSSSPTTQPAAPPNTAPASSTTTTIAIAPVAPPPPSSSSSPPPTPSSDSSTGGDAFSAFNQTLTGEQIEELSLAELALGEQTETQDESTRAARSDSDLVAALGSTTAIMDGTLLMVDFVGSTLPAPVAAPVISTVVVVEMVIRALLSGTQAFVGPALVFGGYAAYRSFVTFVARRRRFSVPV